MKRTWPYDMWSLGVTWLEIVMGTPHVFQVDPRTRAKLYHQLNMEAMSEVHGLEMHDNLELQNCAAACWLGWSLETVQAAAFLKILQYVACDLGCLRMCCRVTCSWPSG